MEVDDVQPKMGRPKVEDNPEFQKLRSQYRALNMELQKLEMQFERAKSNAITEWENALAEMAITLHKNGLSVYAIGKAVGKTSHWGRVEFMEWAEDRMANIEAMRESGEK